MSVLDAEAASLFSTAAALEARGRSTRGSSPPPAAAPKEVKVGEIDSLEHQRSENIKDPIAEKKDHQEPERLGSGEEAKTSKDDAIAQEDESAQLPEIDLNKKTSINWATVKSASVQASKDNSYIADLKGNFDSADLTLGPPSEGVVSQDELHTEVPTPEYDEKLRKIFLPCPEPSALGPSIWEGVVTVPGVGSSTMLADSIAGCGDMSILLKNTLHVKGRLSLGKLDSYLSELHISKHKTASVAVLKPCKGKPRTVDNIESATLISDFSAKGKAGVAAEKDVDVYLVPCSELANKILGTLVHVEPDTIRASFEFNHENQPLMQETMFLAIAVHKKDMIAKKRKRSNKERVSLPQDLDLNAISALAAAVGADVHGSNVSQPEAPSPPPAKPMAPMTSATTNISTQLPANLDLSGLSALANALGVKADTPTSQPPIPPGHPAPMTSISSQRSSKSKPMRPMKPIKKDLRR